MELWKSEKNVFNKTFGGSGNNTCQRETGGDFFSTVDKCTLYATRTLCLLKFPSQSQTLCPNSQYPCMVKHPVQKKFHPQVVTIYIPAKKAKMTLFKVLPSIQANKHYL